MQWSSTDEGRLWPVILLFYYSVLTFLCELRASAVKSLDAMLSNVTDSDCTLDRFVCAVGNNTSSDQIYLGRIGAILDDASRKHFANSVQLLKLEHSGGVQIQQTFFIAVTEAPPAEPRTTWLPRPFLRWLFGPLDTCSRMLILGKREQPECSQHEYQRLFHGCPPNVV
jgi:hypothetical protein